MISGKRVLRIRVFLVSVFSCVSLESGDEE